MNGWSHRVALYALMLSGVLTIACGSDERCAEGTRNVDGECVAEVQCGPGTLEMEGTCVLIGSDTSMGDTTPPPDMTSDAPCVPECNGVTCGDDGCGGMCGFINDEGECVVGECQPRCEGRVCGDDGCSGVCGTCDSPQLPMCQDGACVAACVPDCTGRTCGDDGCGGSCGQCEGSQACSSHGHCVPDTWTCAEQTYDALDHCDCNCGALDPDCESILSLPTVGCGATQVCGEGLCEDTIPAEWTCEPTRYDDQRFCDCACGAPDPDCDLGLPVLGCGSGETCGAGECEACLPDCNGKECGGDGCGGSCGDCADPGFPFCAQDVCTDICEPDCTGKECGDDGCGGTCGACHPDAVCATGLCELPPNLSCAGRCEEMAPGGCSCTADCANEGTCCADFVESCVCEPQCEAKECGDDGCGGDCGPCDDPTNPFCDAQGLCQMECVPNCENHACGDDGCGGTCGTCQGDESCNDHGACVGPEWRCLESRYADGNFCDCACGAPDPDCLQPLPTHGCPFDAACDAATGHCDVSYCAREDSCAGPQACVGFYPTGEGDALLGVCHAPLTGEAIGVPCAAHDDCATGVCAAGVCREHCQHDADCPPSESCVGTAARENSGKPVGGVGICDGANNLGSTCTAQTDCTGIESCLLVFDPVTQQPTPRCGFPRGGAELGHLCDDQLPCAMGLLCAQGRCALPCPGGAADCPTGHTCEPAFAHPGPSELSDDDIYFNACTAP